MNVTRREFLLQSASACAGYALGAAAFAAGVQRFSLINALAQGLDYKALVCVFMAGGNGEQNGSASGAAGMLGLLLNLLVAERSGFQPVDATEMTGLKELGERLTREAMESMGQASGPAPKKG